MFLAGMAVIALFWQTAATSATVKDNEIWLQTASGARQLTHDGVAKRLPTLSPSGDSLIYVVDHPVPLNAPQEEIVLLDLKGEVLRRISPEGYVPGAFDRLEWIDEQRIGAMTCGRANCMYWVLKPSSGTTLEVLRGGFDFIWSHNRQFVARRFLGNWCENARKGQPCPEHDAVLLNRDDVFVYPPGGAAGDEAHSHSIGLGKSAPFIWSPDDKWVAFTDLIEPPGDWYVVLVSPSGDALRDSVPIGPDSDATLEWRDETHLDLHAGGRVFHYAIHGKQFSEVRSDR